MYWIVTGVTSDVNMSSTYLVDIFITFFPVTSTAMSPVYPRVISGALCFRYCDDMEAATVTASTSASDETSHKKVQNTVLKMNLLCQGPWSSCLLKDHCLSWTAPCGFSR